MSSPLPIASFVAAMLVLIPLPWHWRAWNVPAIATVFWLFLESMVYSIGSAFLESDIGVISAVWCDISTRIIVGVNLAIPVASVCICVQLEHLASLRSAKTLEEKARQQVAEGLLCFALPSLWMAAHCLVQGRRFDIVEGLGCIPSTYRTISSILIICVPTLCLSAAGAFFTGCVIRHLSDRRPSARKYIQSRSDLTISQFMRLLISSSIQAVLSAVKTSLLFRSATFHISTPPGWSDVRWAFSRIGKHPRDFISPYLEAYCSVIWWLVPISSLAFFCTFALGRDALREYNKSITWVKNNALGRRIIEPASAATTSSVAPVRLHLVLHFATMFELLAMIHKTNFYLSPDS